MYLLPANVPSTIAQHAPKFTGYEVYADLSRMLPPPVTLKARIELNKDGLMYDVAYVCRYCDLEDEKIYLPHSNDRVAYIKPALGELLRNPQRFVAIVFVDGNLKRARTVSINAGQMLQVV